MDSFELEMLPVTTLQKASRVFLVPLMILVYVGIVAPLGVVVFMDYLFDELGAACGLDTRFWPLPRGQDEDFRFRAPKCVKCRKANI